MISVIIPTFNESSNLPELLPRVLSALDSIGIKHEIVVVDDNSPDGTADVARRFLRDGQDKVIVRVNERGLSSAVVKGMVDCSGDIIAVMDADLSHPPELLPKLLSPVLSSKSSIAVASRYVPGGGVKGWPLKRQIVSRVACILAFPFTTVKDSTSGFFAFRRDIIDPNIINTIGFKIGLEVMVKSRPNDAVEVPFVFTDRLSGKSKFNSKQIFNYLKQLACFI